MQRHHALPLTDAFCALLTHEHARRGMRCQGTRAVPRLVQAHHAAGQAGGAAGRDVAAAAAGRQGQGAEDVLLHINVS